MIWGRSCRSTSANRTRNKTTAPRRRKISNGPIRIRKAAAADIDAVHAIEKEQFTNPWKKAFFQRELSHDIAFFYVVMDDNAGGEIAGGEIAGYVLFWIFGDTLELHDIAVKAHYKRRGLGSQMMEFMLDTARSRDVEEAFLEVRASAAEAIALYKKFGFIESGRRKDYYQQPVEDALIFKLRVHGTLL